jgi:hypothetical protein
MLNLFGNFVQKRRHLIVDEMNVVDSLKVISEIKDDSKIHGLMEMEIGNCGWADKPNAWFMHFSATDKQWRTIITRFNERKFTLVLKDDDRIYLIRK